MKKPRFLTTKAIILLALIVIGVLFAITFGIIVAEKVYVFEPIRDFFILVGSKIKEFYYLIFG